MAETYDAPHDLDNSQAAHSTPVNYGLHGDERGQISVFFVIATAALVILIALVYNTARQTTRKIEMQGAADGAAVAGGAWVARGMNLTALNNNSMAETLSIMITVRSLAQTSETLIPILEALGVVLSPFGIGEELLWEAGVHEYMLNAFLKPVDRALDGGGSGIAWQIMSALDKFNMGIKRGFPKVAQAQAVRLAWMNSADFLPYGLLISGQKDYSLLPQLPLMRGSNTLIARRAKDCQLDKIGNLAWLYLIAHGAASSSLGWFLYQFYVDLNVWSLGGGTPFESLHLDAGTVLKLVGYYGFFSPLLLPIILIKLAGMLSGIHATTEPLNWPESPPRPMILSDAPQTDAEKITDKVEAAVDLNIVREHLQYLAIAFGKQERGSPVGGERFQNPGWWAWKTYAQADVFNPTNWSMFSQDWRVKLARAQLAEVHLGRLLKMPELKGKMMFVNTH